MDDTDSIATHLSEFAPDALVVVDERGLIRYANQAVAAVFGYTRDALLGRPVELLIPERLRARHGAHVAAYLAHPANREMGSRASDLYARRADGSEFPAAIRLAPFPHGGTGYVAAAIRDISERRAISDALIQAREDADRANRAKSRFLATASHDLRQPLQSIRLLNASMMRSNGGDAQLMDLLKSQQLAIDGATRLMNALLDISRLESGAVVAHLAPVQLAEVFGELDREFESHAAAKSLKLEFSPTHVSLRTDRILLCQILQNLIGNALKYTEHGYVRVSQSMEGQCVAITVEDSGVGIPDDKLERIFDEYYQLGPQGTQRLGVGLGLAIVREVARLLNYSLEVISTLGKGTRVRVLIPRELLLSQTQSPALEPARAPPNRQRVLCRVIVVEDNEAVRKATQLFLALEGFETLGAASFAETEQLAARMRPGDILIADYHLDGNKTGVDVLRHVRERLGCQVPAIFLSGDLQSLVRVMKEPIARCRFLSKPVDTAQLLGAIEELSRAHGPAAAPAPAKDNSA